MKIFDKYKVLIIISVCLSILSLSVVLFKETNLGARTENVWRQYNSNAYFGGYVGVGTSTPIYPVEVIDTASTTIAVGGNNKSGCIRIGDSANATNAVYIIASGATITASTTKPSACR